MLMALVSSADKPAGSRPLQNRVDPFGELIATPARGLFMGNRGGRIHDAGKLLGGRRWSSRRWIACVCEFKGRRRKVWGDSYTELFFLDEPTALAAGHRPCFECRRTDARWFAGAWAGRRRTPPSADEMDLVLHAERLNGRGKRRHIFVVDDLPDGAMLVERGRPFAVHGDRLLPWGFEGYGPGITRPRGALAEVLTPPAILNALAHGYEPLWHPSAAAAAVVSMSIAS